MGKRIRAVVLLVGVWILAAGAEDLFILKNGERLEGRIVEKTSEGWILDTAKGQVLIVESDIDKRITGAGATKDMLDAETALEERHYIDALVLFRHAYQNADPASPGGKERRDRIREGVQDTVRRWLPTTERARLGDTSVSLEITPEQMSALYDIEPLLDDAELVERFRARMRTLEELTSQNLIERARTAAGLNQYQKAAELYEQYLKRESDPRIKRELAAMRTKWAEEKFPTDSALAEIQATKAIEIDDEYARAYLVRAQCYLKIRDALKAELDLRKANDLRQQFTQADINVFLVAMRDLKSLQLRPTFPPIPTAIPTPIPDENEKEAVDLSKEAKKWKLFASQWITDIPGNLKKLFSLKNLKSHSKIVAYVVGFIFFYWYLPFVYIKKRARRRAVFNIDWSRVVFWTGLVGLMVYLIASLFVKQKRQYCKACRGNLSNPVLYEDYRFDTCPHCGTKIKPVFTIENLVSNMAKVLVQTGGGIGDAGDGWESLIEVLDMILLAGRRNRAGEIHFVPKGDRFLIRMRIDGVLYDKFDLPPSLVKPLFTSLRSRANLNAPDMGMNQDGRFMARLDDVDITVRITLMAGQEGGRIVARLLDSRTSELKLLELGFPQEHAAHFMELTMNSTGLIAITGPQYSGKTAMLYSILTQLNDGTRSIISLENPVEYDIPGVNQIQHNPATGLSFSTALRSVFSQAPDVVMLGELPDRESASIVIQGAQGNSLALVSLSSPDTLSIIPSLCSMGIESTQLGMTARCFVAQRLVRLLCPECKKSSRVKNDELSHLDAVGAIDPKQEIFAPKGCGHCANTGYRGLTGIFEIMFVTDSMRALIAENAPASRILAEAHNAGFVPLRRQGARLVAKGLTSVEEVMRVTQNVSMTASAAPNPVAG